MTRVPQLARILIPEHHHVLENRPVLRILGVVDHVKAFPHIRVFGIPHDRREIGEDEFHKATVTVPGRFPSLCSDRSVTESGSVLLQCTVEVSFGEPHAPRSLSDVSCVFVA